MDIRPVLLVFALLDTGNILLNSVYSVGFIAAICAPIIRYYVSVETQTAYLDFMQFALWEKVFYLGAYIWAGLAVWNTYCRSRCPQCRSTKISLTHKEELKRWKKKVQENRPADGDRIDIIDVVITMAKVQFTFKCHLCKHSWFKENDIPIETEDA